MANVDVDIKQLLEAGAHFGHKTSRWHPKMAPFIHSKRGGSHIIDLTKTVDALNEALGFVSKTVSEGKQVLVVGTKRQARAIAKNLAEEARAELGINPGTLRLSVGLEDADDLIADLDRALESAA
jgi:ribosomal protein S2